MRPFLATLFLSFALSAVGHAASDATAEATRASEEAARLFIESPEKLQLSLEAYDPTDDRRVVTVNILGHDAIAVTLMLILVDHKVVFLSASGKLIQKAAGAPERERRLKMLVAYLEKWTALHYVKLMAGQRKGYSRIVLCCVNTDVHQRRDESAEVFAASGLLRIFGVPQ